MKGQNSDGVRTAVLEPSGPSVGHSGTAVAAPPAFDLAVTVGLAATPGVGAAAPEPGGDERAHAPTDEVGRPLLELR